MTTFATLATLGIEFTSSTAHKAANDIERLGKAVEQTEQKADKLNATSKKTATGLAGMGDRGAKAAEQIDKVKDKAEAAGTALGKFARYASLVGMALGIRELSQAADAWSDMQSRVGAAIKSMERAPGVLRRLVDVANASYSPLDQTVEVYSRNVGVLRDLGLGANQAADFTESLNHMLVITATKGERAASVQNALAKAMATGKLDAEGLETVLANGGRVAEAFADALGTNVNGLRKMQSEGKLTASVMTGALLDSLEQVRTEAAEMPATIGDGFTRIATGWQMLVGTFDQLAGMSGGVASVLLSIGDGLLWIADHAQDAQGYLIAAAAAVTGYLLPSLVAAAGATATFIASLITLRGVLITTGFGALIVGAGYLINKFLELVRATGGFGEALELLGVVAKGVWDGMVTAAGAIPPGLAGVWENIKSGFLSMVAELIKYWQSFISAVAPYMKINAFAKSKGLTGTMATSFMGTEEFNNFKAPGMDLDGIATDLTAAADRASAAADRFHGEAAAKMAEGAGIAGAALEKLKTSITTTTDALGGEGEEGGGGGGIVDPTDPTKTKGGGGGGKAKASGLIDGLNKANGQLAVGMAEATNQYQERLALLREAYAAELTTRQEHHALIEAAEFEHRMRMQQLEDEANQTVIAARNEMFSNLAGLLGAFGQKSKAAGIAALAINTILRVRETLQNATTAAWQAYTAAGPVAGPAAFAKVMAMGKVSAAFIAAQGAVSGVAQASGGGSGGGGGVRTSKGSGTDATTAEAAPAPQEVTLDFTSADPALRAMAQALMPTMIEQLRKQSKTGVNIVAARY